MKLLLIIMFILSSLPLLEAQESDTTNKSESAMALYLECSSCDMAYLTENMPYADFLTDPYSADVHLIVNKMESGIGSTAVSIVFLGQKRFSFIRDTIHFTVPGELTQEEKRILELEKIELGLVPFLMKTPAADQLMLFVSGDLQTEAGAIKRDPWRNWAFEIYGNGSLSSQKNYNDYNINLGLNINKTMEGFKFESGTMVHYNESVTSYPYYDSVTKSESSIVYKTSQKGFHTSNLAVFSIGRHFGAGGMVLAKNDRPNNMDLRIQAGPAIEFNVFPYKEALQKQFRFMYSLLYEKSNYLEPTIFDKMKDEGLRHSVRVMTQFINDWGYLYGAVQGSSYIQDISRFSLTGSAYASIRVYKNLSFSIQGYMGMYRDQIHQPKGYASLDEILTRQKEMATDYQYGISFGITYRFGSKKFPAVNPRFDR